METQYKKELLRYPRPTDICDNCQGIIILCWGEKVKPYWRHKSTTNSNCNLGKGESYTHKLAKRLIREFLQNGGRINIISNCENCGQGEKEYCSLDVREEMKYVAPNGKSSVFDVGCSMFGIEIYYKHRTTNIEGRDGIDWFEVKADDVMSSLDIKEVPPIINLVNIRQCQICIENKIPYAITEFPTKDCSSEKDRFSQKQILRFDKERLRYSELSFDDIAERLGILVIDRKIYATESRKMVDLALRGKCTESIYQWSTELHSMRTSRETEYIKKLDKKLWYEVKRRGRCLKCENTDSNVGYYKPFCKQCYRETKDEKYEDEEHTQTISYDEKMLLRGKFRWLDKLPGGSTISTPCHLCRKSYYRLNHKENGEYMDYWKPGTSYVENNVWWFGDKKICCTICLESLYQQNKD